MSERGVFAVDRGIFDHDIFAPEPFTEREAWIWLIGEAAYRPHKARVGRVRVDLARGQLAHALRFMAGRWKWSEASVRRYLAMLVRENMITATNDANVTQITICNYDAYQRVSLPDDADLTQTRRRVEDTEDKEEHLRQDARARELSDFLNELAVLCGQDPEFLTPEWMGAQPMMRAQMWLSAGWRIDVMREAAKAAIAKKRDGPPQSVRYFEKIFARAHAPQLPLPSVQIIRSEGMHHEKTILQPAVAPDWRSSRDNFRAAYAKLAAHNEQVRSDPSSDGAAGGPGVVTPLAAARRDRA